MPKLSNSEISSKNAKEKGSLFGPKKEKPFSEETNSSSSKRRLTRFFKKEK